MIDNSWQKLNDYQRILYKELYKRDFYEFVKAFWDTCDPAKFVDGKLIQFYCEAFQYLCRDWVNTPIDYKEVDLPELNENIDIIDIRNNKRNVCINVPPRHSKSIIFSILGSVWLWTNSPVQAAAVCHTEGLATRMNTMRQKIVNSPKFKFFFPEIVLEANSAIMIRDTRGGELYAINRNALLGRGVSIICNDDITNADTARRDAKEMESAWAYYTQTMPSRINDPHKYLILNIQQRLSINDITGRLLADANLSNAYTFIVLPAIFDKPTYVVCPISGEVLFYDAGDFLWPERFGDYSGLRAQVGENTFQAQYLQKPQRSDTSVIKENALWEIPQTLAPDIENAEMVFASHDFPVKDKETSDFLGSILAYKVGGTLYIEDCLEKRMSFVSSVNYVKALEAKFPGIIQIVEDKANGTPLINQLYDEISGLKPYNPGSNSKYQRLEQSTWWLDNVKFVQKKYNKFTNTYELEDSLLNLKNRLLAFPYVEHDDIVDAFSMLVLYVFLDKSNSVYGRALNDANIVDTRALKYNYSDVFFNKEGDTWKVVEIAIAYGEVSKIYALREKTFKASITQGIQELHNFAPNKKMFIDCSYAETLTGIYDNNVVIEHYDDNENFENSVSTLSVALATNKVLIDNNCKLTKIDFESFKYAKNNDNNIKFRTNKDGYVACFRTAKKYYGI